jgi:hypothetical protein
MSAYETKFLIGKLIFLSFLIHVLLLNLFVLKVPVYPPAHKPKIIFWGSFLDSAHLADQSLFKDTKQNTLQADQFIQQDHRLNQYPFPVTDIQKPRVESSMPQNPKPTEKSLFAVNYERQPQTTEEKTTIETRYQETPYIPIRMNRSKDLIK